MGVVLVGIAALNLAGMTGAVMQMVAHGLVAGALFLLIGLLYERTKTREIGHYSSLVQVMPKFAFFTVFAFMAAIGMLIFAARHVPQHRVSFISHLPDFKKYLSKVTDWAKGFIP